jgi:flagellar basal body-associated protein FliL
MGGSVYITLLVLIVLAVAGLFASPFFFIPAAMVLLFLLFSGPLLSVMRNSASRESVGTPDTAEASYDPVGEPHQPGA